MPEETHIPIRAESDILQARQKGREMASSMGFAGVELTLITTAISEISRNIVKYAGEGDIVFWQVDMGSNQGLVIQARDQGPGIPDLVAAMQDGFSTGNGLGLGLPGARRLMDDFEIQSQLGKGTVVTLTKWRRPRPQ
ncbi:MAG: anti-sigma regulatory factor [candidate division FCPU426 bacterium]|jgi:serine/threonine-protein kinase RsbT